MAMPLPARKAAARRSAVTAVCLKNFWNAWLISVVFNYYMPEAETICETEEIAEIFTQYLKNGKI